jgi:hypothetical protein
MPKKMSHKLSHHWQLGLWVRRTSACTLGCMGEVCSLAAAHEKYAALLSPTSPAETRVCSTAGSSMCLHASTRRSLHLPHQSRDPHSTARIGMLHTARDVTMHAWHLHTRPTHPPLFCDVFISRSRTRIMATLALSSHSPLRSACCDTH